MKVTNNTQWSEIENEWNILTDESQSQLIQHALEIHGIEDFALMSVGQLIRITNGDVSFLDIKDDGTIFQVLFARELKNYIDRFIKTYSSFSMPQTIDEKSASSKCQDCTFGESLLIFVRDYFGLQSFESAEQIKLAEVLIAKKDAYNNDVFKKEITKIQLSKYK